MNESPICFGATDNNASSFMVPSNGTLASVKLVHLDGYVRCHHGNLSFWGCGQSPKLDVNVEIRNSSGSPILPSREFLIYNRKGKKQYLRIPGYNSLSPELVLSADFSNPPNVTQGQWLSLFYRDGSSSSREGHRRGKSCCDVYARFI